MNPKQLYQHCQKVVTMLDLSAAADQLYIQIIAAAKEQGGFIPPTTQWLAQAIVSTALARLPDQLLIEPQQATGQPPALEVIL